jgi:KaiC domain protein
MSEEDDWFERALRDLDEESDRSTGDEAGERDVGDDADADAGEAGVNAGESDTDTDAGGAGERNGNEAGGDGVADDAADDDGGADDPFGGVRDDTAEDASDDRGADADEGAGFGGGSFGDGDPFDDGGTGDEGEAFGGDYDDQSDPFGGDADDQGDPFGGDADDQFGQGGEDPFGGGEGDAFGGGTFGDDDPFGGYRGGSSSPGDGFGFGEVGGPGGAGGETGFDVDPDEFESSIDRTNIGIEGLDEMILGGVPQRSLISVIGGAGTGKTTFALQFLNQALEAGGKGVYITLEQTRESILSTASEKGWSFTEYADEGRLAVVAIDPIEMANSLASIRNDLTRLIAEFDADRLVLDSVSLLEMMYDHPAKRRSEVFGFTRSLKEAGVTTLLTSEASETNAYASRHGIVEYLTDAVFVLQYIRGSDFRETRLAVDIQKIRDANHSRETKPYEITDTGISVYGQANIF